MAVMVSRISALPENDLGVVGSSQVAPAVEQSQPANQVSVTSDEPLVTDIPSFDATGDEAPAPETNAATEEIPAAEGGDDSSGSGGSDS
jgi:Rieske Fe-S protein